MISLAEGFLLLLGAAVLRFVVAFFFVVAFAVVFLAVVFPLRQFQLGQLFWDRGWVPFVTTLLMFWSCGILFLKWQKLKRQKAAMLMDLLPTELSEEITVDSIDKFGNHGLQLV